MSKRAIAVTRRSARVTTSRLVARNTSRVARSGVDGERGVPVSFGLDDAAAARARGDDCVEAGGVLATDVLERKRPHAQHHVVGEQGDDDVDGPAAAAPPAFAG